MKLSGPGMQHSDYHELLVGHEFDTVVQMYSQVIVYYWTGVEQFLLIAAFLKTNERLACIWGSVS